MSHCLILLQIFYQICVIYAQDADNSNTNGGKISPLKTQRELLSRTGGAVQQIVSMRRCIDSSAVLQSAFYLARMGPPIGPSFCRFVVTVSVSRLR